MILSLQICSNLEQLQKLVKTKNKRDDKINFKRFSSKFVKESQDLRPQPVQFKTSPPSNLNLLKPHQKPDSKVCLVICADRHASGHESLPYARSVLQIAAQIDVSREFDRFYEI